MLELVVAVLLLAKVVTLAAVLVTLATLVVTVAIELLAPCLNMWVAISAETATTHATKTRDSATSLRLLNSSTEERAGQIAKSWISVNKGLGC